MFDLVGLESRVSRYQADIFLPRRKVTAPLVQEIMDSPEPLPRPRPVRMKVNRSVENWTEAKQIPHLGCVDIFILKLLIDVFFF